MAIRDSAGVYDAAEFADNPEPRCSIVLVLDVSDSMNGVKIDTVNRALGKIRHMLQTDSLAALRADVAIIEFDNEARIVADFTNGTDFEAPVLTTKGGTNFSKAVNLALDIIEARKQSYRDGGIAYYRSLVYFLTDGIPKDDSPVDLSQAARRLAEAEENRSVAFFSFIIRESILGQEFLVDGDKVQDFYRSLDLSERTLTEAGVFGQGPEGVTSFDLNKVAQLTGVSVQEIMDRAVREGVMRTALGELSKLAPRPPLVLNNVEQLDGTIQWLSRSVISVIRSNQARISACHIPTSWIYRAGPGLNVCN